MMKANRVDAIVVLGAPVHPDGTPSEALVTRLHGALACYEANPAPVLCCGARGKKEPCAESAFIARWLIEKGIPDEMLIEESGSRDTLENIRNASEIMRAHGWARALVVTSDYHMPRALAICRRFHVDAARNGCPSPRGVWIKGAARECLGWGKFVLMWRPEWITSRAGRHHPFAR